MAVIRNLMIFAKTLFENIKKIPAGAVLGSGVL